jgi:hypothetical protein
MKRIIPAVVLVVFSALTWLIFFFAHIHGQVWLRVAHVVLFAPWSFSLLLFLRITLQWRLPALKQYALLIGVAVFCEVIQFWTPGHDPEWSGLAASLVGVILGREIYKMTVRN